MALNSVKVSQLGLLLKKNKNVGRELRGKRATGDLQAEDVNCMACCEQEPTVFPLLQIMGQEG